MKRKRILPFVVLTILIVSFLSVAFIMGCGNDSDDGGSSTTATLTGTVKNSGTGAVISGATVQIDNTQTTTESNGTYTISNISTGTYTLTVSATGYQSYQGSVNLLEGSNTKNVTLTPVTTQTGSLTGTVKYGSTTVDGVLVQLQGVGNYTTGTDGLYSFTQVSYGTYTLTAMKTGYSDYTASVTIASATNTHDITLTLGQDLPEPEAGKGHVTGYVTDDSGNPLANVQCTLYTHDTKEVGKYVIVYTDANGKYVFLNVNPGNYQLLFALSGYNIPFIILDVNSGEVTEPPVNPSDPVNPDPGPDPQFTVLKGTVTASGILSLNRTIDVSPSPSPSISPSPSPSISPSPSPSVSPTPIPLEDVTVILGADGKPGGVAVQTDANGFYQFSNPPTGSVKITGAKTGYQNYSNTITITPLTVNIHDFSMTAEP